MVHITDTRAQKVGHKGTQKLVKIFFRNSITSERLSNIDLLSTERVRAEK